MAFVPVAMMLAGGALGAIGSVTAASSQAQGMKAQASIADSNAQAASAQASQKQDQLLRSGRMQIGEQSAEAAQSGAGMGGSNADLIRQSEGNLGMDVLNAGHEGTVQRTSYQNQAIGLRRQASATLTSGWIGAGSKLLQGAGNYAMAGGKLPSFG